MINIREVKSSEKELIKSIVEIHMATFKGFFLTFMGKRFLKTMYKSYCEHHKSGLYVAIDENEKAVGFLAWSGELSNLYKYMIKRKLVTFAFCSLGAFFRKPKIFSRLVRAFLKPGESTREEKYVELASIGVSPEAKSKGIGSKLIDKLKENIDFSVYEYITLETDAVDNDGANHFYQKNGFVLERTFETHEGRKMNEYRFRG